MCSARAAAWGSAEPRRAFAHAVEALTELAAVSFARFVRTVVTCPPFGTGAHSFRIFSLVTLSVARASIRTLVVARIAFETLRTFARERTPIRVALSVPRASPGALAHGAVLALPPRLALARSCGIAFPVPRAHVRTCWGPAVCRGPAIGTKARALFAQIGRAHV